MPFTDPEKKKAYAKQYHKAWYAKNKEKKLAQNKEWAEANPERYQGIISRWKKNNPDKQKASIKRWNAANPERVRENRNAWRKANVIRVRATLKSWRQGNAKYCESRYRRRVSQELRLGTERFSRPEVFERDQGFCYLCNKEVDPKDWHLDHVLPLSRGGEHTLDNVAVTHPACNLSKGARTPWELEINETQ